MACANCEGLPTLPPLRISQPYDGYTTSPGFGPNCKCMFTTWTLNLLNYSIYLNSRSLAWINLFHNLVGILPPKAIGNHFPENHGIAGDLLDAAIENLVILAQKI